MMEGKGLIAEIWIIVGCEKCIEITKRLEQEGFDVHVKDLYDSTDPENIDVEVMAEYAIRGMVPLVRINGEWVTEHYTRGLI